MPKINWIPSNRGGWFATDKYGNRWQKPANGEVISVIAPDGSCGMGFTEEQAWDAFLTSAA